MCVRWWQIGCKDGKEREIYNDFHIHNLNVSVRKLLQKVAHDGSDNNGRYKGEDVTDERAHPEANIGETST